MQAHVRCIVNHPACVHIEALDKHNRTRGSNDPPEKSPPRQADPTFTAHCCSHGWCPGAIHSKIHGGKEKSDSQVKCEEMQGCAGRSPCTYEHHNRCGLQATPNKRAQTNSLSQRWSKWTRGLCTARRDRKSHGKH